MLVGNKTIPNINAKVSLLDSDMRTIVKNYIIEGIWIQNLEEIKFQYSDGASQALTCKCKFAMQYFYEDTNKYSEGNPL